MMFKKGLEDGVLLGGCVALNIDSIDTKVGIGINDPDPEQTFMQSCS